MQQKNLQQLHPHCCVLLNSDTATLNLRIDEELLLLSPLRPHDPNKRNEVKYYINLSEDYM